MKNILIILNLIFITCAFGYQVTYTERNPMYGYCPCNKSYRNTLNPYYNPNYNSYRFNKNLKKPIYYNNQPNQIKSIRRLQRNIFNTLSNLNNNAKGGLTGYSVPINKNDIYYQTNTNPYNSNPIQHSKNATQELFSLPSIKDTYYDNGDIYRDSYGISGKTGVTIIYD